MKDASWEAANAFAMDTLTNTSTMKLSHGPPGALDAITLADLWDSEEHHNKDIVEGHVCSLSKVWECPF